MDLEGNESQRVLKHAFLNSYFQTGLKNLIDVAIISRAEKENMNIYKETYTREDEIPFDFSRRCLSVAVEIDNKDELITKGAVEEILNICTTFEYKGQTEKLTNEKIMDMMSEEKPNQKSKIKISEDKLRSAIPKSVRVDNYEDFIFKAIDYYSKHLEKAKSYER